MLFSRIAEGDEEAYRMIFHEQNARLFYTVQKLVKSAAEAEDIIQETFLRLWLRRHTLPGIENPVAWLHTIASNLALDALRRQAKERVRVKAGETESMGPDIAFDAKEAGILIQQAIRQLPPSRRKVFELSRNEGLSRREIAEKLHISESTVKNQLTAAFRFIQDHIEKAGTISLPAAIVGLCIKIFYRG